MSNDTGASTGIWDEMMARMPLAESRGLPGFRRWSPQAVRGDWGTGHCHSELVEGPVLGDKFVEVEWRG